MEIMSAPVAWQHIDKSTGTGWNSYLFHVDDVQYEVEIWTQARQEDNKVIKTSEVMFTGQEGSGSPKDGIMGTGNAFTVFATVADIVQDFIKNVPTDELTFTAAERSRIKLYDRFGKILASHGWKLARRGPDKSHNIEWAYRK